MAVRAAGFDTQTKLDGSIVTIADQRAEAIIEAGLTALAPGVPMIGEEAVAAGRIPECGDALLLRRSARRHARFRQRRRRVHREHRAGRERRADDGRRATRRPPANSTPANRAARSKRVCDPHTARPMTPLDADRAASATPRAMARRRLAISPAATSARDAFSPRSNGVATHASSSIKFCRLAEGAADLYPRFGEVSEWDAAAGHAILSAAGGGVMRLDGAPLRYGDRDGRFLDPRLHRVRERRRARARRGTRSSAELRDQPPHERARLLRSARSRSTRPAGALARSSPARTAPPECPRAETAPPPPHRTTARVSLSPVSARASVSAALSRSIARPGVLERRVMLHAAFRRARFDLRIERLGRGAEARFDLVAPAPVSGAAQIPRRTRSGAPGCSSPCRPRRVPIVIVAPGGDEVRSRVGAGARFARHLARPASISFTASITAETPSSGKLECASRPVTSTMNERTPLCAETTFMLVGSPTITAAGFGARCARCPRSSPARRGSRSLRRTKTPASIGRFSGAASAASTCASASARKLFMSATPRP